MSELSFASVGLRFCLVTGLVVVFSGCATGTGKAHSRPHAARDPAIPKLEARPPMVARDEAARDEVATASPDEEGDIDSQAEDPVEEIVVTGTRRETSPAAGATAGSPAAAPTTALAGNGADGRAGLLSEVDRILAGLPLGNAAFGVPPQMKVGERTTARLRLSLQESAATLAEEIGRLSPDAAAVLSDPVRVHTVMLARLDGTSGLEIRLLGGQEERTLDSAATEEWVWEVTAVQPGAESVHLELFAVIEVQGEQRKNLRRSWDAVVAVVAVEVPPLQQVPPESKWSGLLAWVGKNFQWLWAAILVPLGGLAYRTYQARRRKEPPPGFTKIKEVSKEVSKTSSKTSRGEAPEVTDHAD